PSGQLSPDDQIVWLERLIGRAPDGILTQEPINRSGVTVLDLDLAEASCHWRHDREKLRHGIEILSQKIRQSDFDEYLAVS
nr:hypothetical protein [Aeromonadaceae bacterium]